MEERIKVAMRESMKDLLNGILLDAKGKEMSAENVEWVERLLLEVKGRVVRLTPSRLDLQREFVSSFDVPYMLQILRHGAFEDSDFVTMGCVLLDRIALLCAPCQDKEVGELRRGLCSGSVSFSDLLFSVHSVVDEIERMAKSEEAKRVRELYLERTRV